MRHSKPALVTALIAPLLCLAVAACGGGTPKGGSSSSAGSSASASAKASNPATGRITANWETFFNAKTPTAQRVKLLQNGQQFAAVLKAQASSPLASQATAKVARVSVVSATQAKVTYTVLLAGTPALSNRAGTAILQGGVWKVGDASFCGLLALENGGKTSSLPAACASAAG
jgi:hypothetical protein